MLDIYVYGKRAFIPLNDSNYLTTVGAYCILTDENKTCIHSDIELNNLFTNAYYTELDSLYKAMCHIVKTYNEDITIICNKEQIYKKLNVYLKNGKYNIHEYKIPDIIALCELYDHKITVRRVNSVTDVLGELIDDYLSIYDLPVVANKIKWSLN